MLMRNSGYVSALQGRMPSFVARLVAVCGLCDENSEHWRANTLISRWRSGWLQHHQLGNDAFSALLSEKPISSVAEDSKLIFYIAPCF